MGKSSLIIYGASGWMGQSFIESFLNNVKLISKYELISIASSKKIIKIGQQKIETEILESANRSIRPNSILVNCAFLRREFLDQLSEREYIQKNLQLTKNVIDMLQKHNFEAVINLSSGVAGLVHPENSKFAVYAKLKLQAELEIKEICDSLGIRFINSRIFSITGHHINEFNNLAISVLAKEALRNKTLTVYSPNTRRTFLDSVELAALLLELSVDPNFNYLDLDSGGQLASMKDLAIEISKQLDIPSNRIYLGEKLDADYFGNYQNYNAIALRKGVQQMKLNLQVKETLKKLKLQEF